MKPTRRVLASEPRSIPPKDELSPGTLRVTEYALTFCAEAGSSGTPNVSTTPVTASAVPVKFTATTAGAAKRRRGSITSIIGRHGNCKVACGPRRVLSAVKGRGPLARKNPDLHG